jgi:hypothetical protein
MIAEKIINIPGLLNDAATQQLVFEADGLTIEKRHSFRKNNHVMAHNMVGFRYGITWIRGTHFAFGRQYFVELQSDEGKTTRIKLNSFYGIRKEIYGKLWNDIIQQLWQSYFVNTYNYYYDLYKIHQTFELCGIRFYNDGIGWDQRNILFFDQIAISSYYHYFMIYNKLNKKQCKSRNFANDWNAVILQVLIKEIVKERSVLQS